MLAEDDPGEYSHLRVKRRETTQKRRLMLNGQGIRVEPEEDLYHLKRFDS